MGKSRMDGTLTRQRRDGQCKNSPDCAKKLARGAWRWPVKCRGCGCAEADHLADGRPFMARSTSRAPDLAPRGFPGGTTKKHPAFFPFHVGFSIRAFTRTHFTRTTNRGARRYSRTIDMEITSGLPLAHCKSLRIRTVMPKSSAPSLGGDQESHRYKGFNPRPAMGTPSSGRILHLLRVGFNSCLSCFNFRGSCRCDAFVYRTADD